MSKYSHFKLILIDVIIVLAFGNFNSLSQRADKLRSVSKKTDLCPMSRFPTLNSVVLTSMAFEVVAELFNILQFEPWAANKLH